MTPCSVRPSKAKMCKGNLAPFVDAGGGENEKVPDELRAESMDMNIDVPVVEDTNN